MTKHTSKFPFVQTRMYGTHSLTVDLDARDFRTMLGFSGPYPADASAEATICGHRVWLTPKTKKHMEMRVWTECPDCGKIIAPGKLRQHMREAKKREAAAEAGTLDQLRKPGETNRQWKLRLLNQIAAS